MMVTPCVGVWIEILSSSGEEKYKESLPAWECGLKFDVTWFDGNGFTVTPCVGVWIDRKSVV